MRVYYYKFYNELILILINDVNLFYIIILNFILILIDKFTKYVTYIIIIKHLKADKFINIL